MAWRKLGGGIRANGAGERGVQRARGEEGSLCRRRGTGVEEEDLKVATTVSEWGRVVKRVRRVPECH